MPQETINPEELVDAHRASHHELERAKRAQADIRRSGVIKRGISKIKGKNEAAQKSVEEAQEAYDDSSQIPEEQVATIHRQVNEVLATRADYDLERQRVVEEVSPQYKKRVEDINWPGEAPDEEAYVEDYEAFAGSAESLTSNKLARVLAVRDVFYPKIDNPGYAGSTFMIGEGYNKTELAIHNGSRFPRFEIGSDELKDAASAASSNGWNKIVKMSVAVSAGKAKESGEEPYILGEENVYTAVSDETAELLELAIPGMGRTSGLSEAFGRRQGMGTGTTSHVEFSTLDVSESGEGVSQAA